MSKKYDEATFRDFIHLRIKRLCPKHSNFHIIKLILDSKMPKDVKVKDIMKAVDTLVWLRYIDYNNYHISLNDD